MDVVTMVVTTDILTHTDTDTTVERELLMLNQKLKLPLIQVPGTDMVVTMATHTDMVDTGEVTHTDMVDTMDTAVDTTMDKSENCTFYCNIIANYPTLPYLHLQTVFSNIPEQRFDSTVQI